MRYLNVKKKINDCFGNETEDLQATKSWNSTLAIDINYFRMIKIGSLKRKIKQR
jgi:hypothetical protein